MKTGSLMPGFPLGLIFSGVFTLYRNDPTWLVLVGLVALALEYPIPWLIKKLNKKLEGVSL